MLHKRSSRTTLRTSAKRLRTALLPSVALAALIAPVAVNSAVEPGVVQPNEGGIPHAGVPDPVGAKAQQVKVRTAPLPMGKLPLVTTAKMTRFDPAQHGFRFVNSFQNVIGVFDIVLGGLCGGMVYSSLDYFNSDVPTPRQSYRPVAGTTLENHIFTRQTQSLESHIDKWMELHVNPFGARNSEFFKWGLQGSGGGRLQELRAKIDAGQPVPLGLKSMSADPGSDHVVLAYGYDMGRYKGDLGEHQTDLKIFIYDPNYGSVKTTLVPVPAEAKWCHVEPNNRGERPCWRSYFVQQNYRRTTPPRIADRPVELRISFKTGGDDLRGGNDNVSVKVRLKDGRTVGAPNVNRSKRWIDQSLNTVGISLPENVRADSIREIIFSTSFGGGIGGDNWNLDQVIAKLHINDVEVTGCTIEGRPAKRFTGSDSTLVTRFPC